MGFTGAFALAAAGFEELGWLGGTDGDESFPGGWTALVLDDEDAFWERDQVLAQLVEQTGRPALVALCLDSDFLGIVGRTPDGRTWDGVVDAESAAAARAEGLEEEYDVVVPVFAAPEEAVAGAVAWAGAAGMSPDEAALRRLFEVTEWEQPADQYWPELLAALRVESAPAPTVSPSGRSTRPASRTKPLDQVVRDRIAPVLKELGFSRKGRKFTLERADGARAWVTVHGYRSAPDAAEFIVEFFVQPKIWRDLMAFRHGHDSDREIWSERVRWTSEPVVLSDLWSFELADEATGAALTRAVTEVSSSALSYLDPEPLLALLRSGERLRGHLGSRRDAVLPVLMAAAEGPSAELEARLAAMDQDPEWADVNPIWTAFVRSRLAEHP